MMEWKPIKTAPDDAYVLVFGPLTDGSGHYHEVQKKYRAFRAGNAMVWPVQWMHNCEPPTHWMPLPPPPQEPKP